MSETGGDISFDELKKKYYFLEYLPLANVFSVFSLNKYHVHQQKAFCNDLSGDTIGACDIHSLCLSLHEILENLKILFQRSDLNTKINWCEHLGHWIYDNIKNGEECSDAEELYTQFQNIKLIYLPTFGCNIEYFKITEDEYFKKKKIALYSEILSWIENSYYSIFYDYTILYDQFLDECYKFYKEIMCNNINSEIKKKYESQLQNFKKIFNKTLSFLKEQRLNISQTEIPSKDESLCISVNRKPSEEYPEVKAPDMEDSASRRQVQIKPEVVTVGTEEFKPDISGSLDQKGTMGTGDIGDSPDRAISNPVGTIMGTSLGFFIPLTMLYKVSETYTKCIIILHEKL
ncbi:hypothetical protein PVBG_05542 [Plasmodium vivax Brazil I]|uniref:PIR Superfamily Protein n=1 Tax=Plasmodium vivax (strain Brazil I) TaxID=1033975 RepID=A0A0J9T0Y6_PLAV1|nr:hypothetical protein PVBG_05542 [Plasmodium vivax Brazil I]